jgi:DNA polymerase (family X)
VLAQGPTKGSIVTSQGRQVDLRVVTPSSYGAALQYFTGSKAHNIALREMARQRKLKINEYGVFKGEKRVAGETEASIYAALGLPWIPPELREDRGEIDAAAKGRLPRLIEPDDIRGDLHVHTEWSDGRGTIEYMALRAKAKGYEYVVISDHTRALKVFGGLSEDEFLKQIEAIRQVDARLKGIRVLSGVEVDIRADGSLDLSDEVLSRLDFVTASVHSGFKQSREAMTRRIVQAMRNKNVDSLGHPTGRLLGARDPYDVDMDAVIREAAAKGTLLEIDAQPERLDLADTACRRAKELGAMLVINSDAHGAEQLDYMRFGVATARRGWLEPSDVINTRPGKEFVSWLKRRG